MREPRSAPVLTRPVKLSDNSSSARRLTMERYGPAGLLGRTAERARLDEMVDALRAGKSHVLVVRGAPGIGKSALLGYAEDAATGLRVLRTVGIESEME